MRKSRIFVLFVALVLAGAPAVGCQHRKPCDYPEYLFSKECH